MSPINAIVYLYFKQYFGTYNVTQAPAWMNNSTLIENADLSSTNHNGFIMALAKRYFIVVNSQAMTRLETVDSFSSVYNLELSNHSIPIFNIKDKIKTRHCQLPLSLTIPADILLPKGSSIIDSIRNTFVGGQNLVRDMIDSLDESFKGGSYDQGYIKSKTQDAKNYVEMAIKALQSINNDQNMHDSLNLKSTIDRMANQYKNKK